jgi:hypothetical protein
MNELIHHGATSIPDLLAIESTILLQSALKVRHQHQVYTIPSSAEISRIRLGSLT